MKIIATAADILVYDGDAIIVNLFEKSGKPGGATAAVDKELGGIISKLITDGQIKGRPGETTIIPAYGKLHARKVVVVGLGKKNEFSIDRIRRAASASLIAARKAGAKRCATIMHGAGAGEIAPRDCARAITEGAFLGLYRFDSYKTKTPGDDTKEISEITIYEIDKTKLAAIREGISFGRTMAESANLARDLVNEPPNVMTPSELARRAKDAMKGLPVSVKIMGLNDILRLKMGAFAGVAQGSHEEPKFIIMSYKGNPASRKTTALVGKGVTFDSGGISLKPSSAMDDMKCDMSGAACVISAMRIIGAIAPKANVTGFVPATENMPGGGAQRVGDIVRAMNGKTVEIKNTDAEGRLILADAICYAKQQGCEPIIDVATLTGACMIALGSHRTGAFTNDPALLDRIAAASEKTGELLWRMPSDDEYKELNKSDIADIKNTGGRYGGAITGALFCGFFAEETSWAHLDIAGTAFLDKTTGYYAVKGATGAVARTLAQFIIDGA